MWYRRAFFVELAQNSQQHRILLVLARLNENKTKEAFLNLATDHISVSAKIARADSELLSICKIQSCDIWICPCHRLPRMHFLEAQPRQRIVETCLGGRGTKHGEEY
ncbi:hypothetical protein NKI48_00935 [Mesorhizobium sp. M0644]|uniref:hypothetical protein n=1 Tax=unclassified Mesorhizobium TaxID=325217 RepID=UPI003337E284